MSLSESIIIPLSLFKACQFENIVKRKSQNILDKTNIPSSKRMMIYNHEQSINKRRNDNSKKTIEKIGEYTR